MFKVLIKELSSKKYIKILLESSALLLYYRRPMNELRQNQIQQHINEAFEAINKLSDLITIEDLQWADKNYDNNEFASELNALAENLIDNGKQFYLYED